MAQLLLHTGYQSNGRSYPVSSLFIRQNGNSRCFLNIRSSIYSHYPKFIITMACIGYWQHSVRLNRNYSIDLKRIIAIQQQSVRIHGFACGLATIHSLISLVTQPFLNVFISMFGAISMHWRWTRHTTMGGLMSFMRWLFDYVIGTLH